VTTAEFLDRWRIPGEPASHVWEERFAETIYGPLADGAVFEQRLPATNGAETATN